jgi:ABC-type sugar transport system permease subunit
MFQRSELGRGSAAAVLLLLSLVAVMAPYGLYVRWQRQKQARV